MNECNVVVASMDIFSIVCQKLEPKLVVYSGFLGVFGWILKNCNIGDGCKGSWGVT